MGGAVATSLLPPLNDVHTQSETIRWLVAQPLTGLISSAAYAHRNVADGGYGVEEC